MPSPIGHSLAGLAIGWLSETRGDAATPDTWRRPSTWSPLVLWCAALAALPDADLLLLDWHRTATHSVTATALIFIVSAAVTGKVTGRPNWRIAGAFAAAHATHLLLDWLGTDRFPPPGIQLFWPFSDRFYISGLDVFLQVERRLYRPEALAVDIRAAVRELAIMGPIAASAWLLRWWRVRGERWRLQAKEVVRSTAEREPTV